MDIKGYSDQNHQQGEVYKTLCFRVNHPWIFRVALMLISKSGAINEFFIGSFQCIFSGYMKEEMNTMKLEKKDKEII